MPRVKTTLPSSPWNQVWPCSQPLAYRMNVEIVQFPGSVLNERRPFPMPSFSFLMSEMQTRSKTAGVGAAIFLGLDEQPDKRRFCVGHQQQGFLYLIL